MVALTCWSPSSPNQSRWCFIVGHKWLSARVCLPASNLWFRDSPGECTSSDSADNSIWENDRSWHFSVSIIVWLCEPILHNQSITLFLSFSLYIYRFCFAGEPSLIQLPLAKDKTDKHRANLPNSFRSLFFKHQYLCILFFLNHDSQLYFINTSRALSNLKNYHVAAFLCQISQIWK